MIKQMQNEGRRGEMSLWRKKQKIEQTDRKKAVIAEISRKKSKKKSEKQLPSLAF